MGHNKEHVFSITMNWHTTLWTQTLHKKIEPSHEPLSSYFCPRARPFCGSLIPAISSRHHGFLFRQTNPVLVFDETSKNTLSKFSFLSHCMVSFAIFRAQNARYPRLCPMTPCHPRVAYIVFLLLSVQYSNHVFSFFANLPDTPKSSNIIALVFSSTLLEAFCYNQNENFLRHVLLLSLCSDFQSQTTWKTDFHFPQKFWKQSLVLRPFASFRHKRMSPPL